MLDRTTGVDLNVTLKSNPKVSPEMAIQESLKSLKDNLSALIALGKSTDKTDKFDNERVLKCIEKLDGIQFKLSKTLNLDFARNTVVIKRELCEQPDRLSAQILHCVVALTNRDLNPKVQLSDLALGTIYTDCQLEAKVLFKMLESEEGQTLGLVDDFFVESILDVLAPTEEELKDRERFVNKPLEPGEQGSSRMLEPSVSKDLRLLSPLLKASLKHKKLKQAIETSYKLFGRELDQALFINNREERTKKVVGVLADVINTIGELILIETNDQLDSLSKLSERGSKKLVAWLSKAFEGYLLSRGAESDDILRSQDRIKLGFSSLDVKSEIFSYLRIDGLRDNLISNLLRVSLTKADILKFGKSEVQDSPLTIGLQAVAGTTGGQNLNLGFSGDAAICRIGHSGENGVEGVQFEDLSDPKSLAKPCTEYSEVLGLKTMGAIRPLVLAKLAQYKNLSELIRYLPSGLSDLVFAGLADAREGETSSTSIEKEALLPHLLDMYFAHGNKTIQDTWTKWCNKDPLFNKNKRDESIELLKVQYKNSEALHQHDTILAASFLAVALCASHRSHLNETQNVQAQLGELVGSSNNSFYALVQVLFESLNNSEKSLAQSETDTVVESRAAIDTDIEDSQPTKKERRRFGFRKKEKSQAEPSEEVQSYDLSKQLEAQELKQTFKAFSQRVLNHSDEMTRELVGLSLEDQKRTITLLLSGGLQSVDFDKTHREISRKTHPDALVQAWPDSPHIQECLKSVFQSVTEFKKLLFDEGEYSQAESIKHIENIAEKLNLFEELQEDFKSVAFSSESKKILDAVRLNTDRIEALQKSVDDISDRLPPGP